MKQSTLSVTLEVEPRSCVRLSALIDALRRQEETEPFGIPEKYDRLKTSIPSLHFMSISVFPDAHYDPILIIECNFDGPAGAFWGQLEAALGEELRGLLRCCKPPRDEDAGLYAAVAAPGSRAPVAPYLEARTQRPSVFHHGNRGLTRDRILGDAALFLALRDEIDGAHGASPYRGRSADVAHAALRAAMLPRFPWLKEKAPTRIGALERVVDIGRFALFAVIALFVLSLPGLVLAPFLPWRGYLILIAVLAASIALAVFLNRKGPPGSVVSGHFPLAAFKPKFLFLLLLGIVAYTAAVTLLLIPGIWAAGWIGHWLGAGAAPILGKIWWPVARTVVLGLAGVLVSVPLILLWLRYLEKRDSAHDAPQVDEEMLRQMVRREDWIAQNHMGSIVLIKPGILRAIIIRAGHLGLGLMLRVVATNGYLGSMRTVHFAHWAFLNNGSRLVFFSNFDFSWDSYLDDFIEKAHEGLTVAWGCGVGFPATRFLIYEGASHGRQFKNWALASRAVSRFWYSAYRELTVDQIERNHRIANGLRSAQLGEKKAAAWMRDL
jgi:hypothetical protein